MFEKIKFWQEERKIHKHWTGLEDECDEEYVHELFDLDQKRRCHSDRKLIKRARRYYVPIPPQSDKDGLWEEHSENEWFLTEEGISHLRKMIREEQKASRERILAWVPLISAITGLLGTILGLAFFLSK